MNNVKKLESLIYLLGSDFRAAKRMYHLQLEESARPYISIHNWYRREVEKYEFHPIIKEILEKHSPADLKLLAYEYPHISLANAEDIAYTRSEDAGERDIQTVTRFGRYIRRHFPEMKDHEIRDYATRCKNDVYQIYDTIEEIVRSVQEGPKSCMQWDEAYSPPNSYWKDHPYNVYDPKYGWKVAVRLHPETLQINGRALINTEDKVFVRSYKRPTRQGDYSGSDEALEFFLKGQGYERANAWPRNTKLLYIEHPRNEGFLAPYLDGDTQRVDIKHDAEGNKFLAIRDDGDYELNRTDGTSQEERDCYCDCCGDYFNHEEMYGETYDGDYICDGCRGNSYLDVYAGRVGEVVVHEDYSGIIEFDGERYLEDAMSYYDLAYDHDGEVFSTIDDTHVFCESNGEYYPEGDYRVARAEEDDLFYFVEDLYEVDGKFYTTNPEKETEDEQESTVV